MSQLPRRNNKPFRSKATTIQDLFETSFEIELANSNISQIKSQEVQMFSTSPATIMDIKKAYPKIAEVEGWAEKIIQVSKRLEIADPGWLANLMYFETDYTLNPGNMNNIGCGGLLKFCPDSSAKKIGKTVTQLVAMDAVEQMEYVELYLHPYKGNFNTSADLYMAIYFPTAQGKGPKFNIYNWYVKNMGTEMASIFLNASGGVKTAGDYQVFADQNAKLPTILKPDTRQL
tara:strand:+ start:179 stop:871 length:693 start_codon:yes stop_codon:yes gene_type:complete